MPVQTEFSTIPSEIKIITLVNTNLLCTLNLLVDIEGGKKNSGIINAMGYLINFNLKINWHCVLLHCIEPRWEAGETAGKRMVELSLPSSISMNNVRVKWTLGKMAHNSMMMKWMIHTSLTIPYVAILAHYLLLAYINIINILLLRHWLLVRCTIDGARYYELEVKPYWAWAYITLIDSDRLW